MNELLVDHLRSTRVMTQANGTVCMQMDYLPYGQEQPASTNPNTCTTSYKFTGYERDSETWVNGAGLDYAFARYYNARLGRFMSGDPLAGDTGDPQSLNRYAYVRNNPINFTDPTGMGCTGPPDDRTCTDDPPPDPPWPGGPPLGDSEDPNDPCVLFYLCVPFPPCYFGGCARPTPQNPRASAQRTAKIDQQALQQCLNDQFGGAYRVISIAPSTPGIDGSIVVRGPDRFSQGGRTIDLTIRNDAHTYTAAQLGPLCGGLSSAAGCTSPRLPGYPYTNYTNNNNNALGTVTSQVHELGHSLFVTQNGSFIRESRERGSALERCVAGRGGFQ